MPLKSLDSTMETAGHTILWELSASIRWTIREVRAIRKTVNSQEFQSAVEKARFGQATLLLFFFISSLFVRAF